MNWSELFLMVQSEKPIFSSYLNRASQSESYPWSHFLAQWQNPDKVGINCVVAGLFRWNRDWSQFFLLGINCIALHFNDEETLQIWHPAGRQIDEHQFIIFSASRVLWRWYYYGRSHTPDNLMSWDFVRNGAEIEFQRIFPHSPQQTPSTIEPAVQIH